MSNKSYFNKQLIFKQTFYMNSLLQQPHEIDEWPHPSFNSRFSIRQLWKMQNSSSINNNPAKTEWKILEKNISSIKWKENILHIYTTIVKYNWMEKGSQISDTDSNVARITSLCSMLLFQYLCMPVCMCMCVCVWGGWQREGGGEGGSVKRGQRGQGMEGVWTASRRANERRERTEKMLSYYWLLMKFNYCFHYLV